MKLYDTLTGLFGVIGGITVFVLATTDTWYGWVARGFLIVLLFAYLFNQRAIEERDFHKLGAMEKFERTMRGNTPWNK